jgi:hypothetical protein
VCGYRYIGYIKTCPPLLAPQRFEGYVARTAAFGYFAKNPFGFIE